VEAFPNAFLGVLMPEEELALAPKFKRGRRFDWLYAQVVTTGRLESLLSKGLDLPAMVWRIRPAIPVVTPFGGTKKRVRNSQFVCLGWRGRLAERPEPSTFQLSRSATRLFSFDSSERAAPILNRFLTCSKFQP
jgi:hypothetical protein